MSKLIEHAKREFAALGYKSIEQCENDPDKWIQENVLELLKTFAAQGHSGSSAPFAIQYFTKLAAFEPLAPLTGADDEWCNVSEGIYQNKRCCHVFKQADRFDGQAYDLDGKIFREPSGACYTSSDSMVQITFPYTPTREYVDVAARSDD